MTAHPVQFLLVNFSSAHFFPREVLCATSLGKSTELGASPMFGGEKRVQRTATHILRSNLHGEEEGGTEKREKRKRKIKRERLMRKQLTPSELGFPNKQHNFHVFFSGQDTYTSPHKHSLE